MRSLGRSFHIRVRGTEGSQPKAAWAGLASCLALAAVPVVVGAQSKRQAIALSDTMGSFRFVDAHDSADRPIAVWYYRPPRRRPDA